MLRRCPSYLYPGILALAVSLGGGPAAAAINPASPGLPHAKAHGVEAIPNNGASAMCVECHTANPRAGGTHFVVNDVTGELRKTNSGGGWGEAVWGVRTGGEFFKVTRWVEEEWGNGGVSKYGDANTWESVVYVGAEGVVGAEACREETSPPAMAGLELICESCHSLRVNVEGRSNLLCKVTSSPVLDDTVDGDSAPLCVGCHGFLYQDDAGAANYIHANWNDPRNLSLVTGGRRGNNERHFIRGTMYPRNHHVTTGDSIDFPVVEAGLTLRDVKVLSPDMVSTPISLASRKGTMPIRQVPVPPMVYPSVRANLHCLTCHVPGHGGEPTMGAAILRGENLRGKDLGFGIDRIHDGKFWMRFSDQTFCTMCHE